MDADLSARSITLIERCPPRTDPPRNSMPLPKLQQIPPTIAAVVDYE
ncbi:MAG: alpha-hydroxy-acid oxidizing enzyme, partial [Ectopseudomonas oleovorans]